MPTSKEQLKVHIRWLIRRDMPEVLKIEKGSFKDYAWCEEDFLCLLRQRNCIGMVAENNHHICGFMIYELHGNKLRILNFAVHPDYRLQNVGTQMAKNLTEKLSLRKRREVTIEIRETNLDAQLFFKKQQFRAITTLRKFYDDTYEDAYVFSYGLSPEKDAEHFENMWHSRNRISEYDTH